MMVDRDEDTFARRPGAGDRVSLHMGEQLIVDALRHKKHPTHFNVAEALDVVARLRPSRAYFTHICHDLPHAATNASLPKGVELAYDGLTLSIDVERSSFAKATEDKWT